ncbi:MAG: ABC transporter permease [Mycobacteriales bacterium]
MITAVQRRPRRRSPRRALNLVAKLPVFVVAGLAWEYGARAADSVFVPPLSEAAGRFVDDWLGGPAKHLFLSRLFLDNALPTIYRLLAGWAIVAVLGIVLGFVIASFPRIGATVDPLVQLGMSVPPPALLPLAIALFGLGTSMKVFLIAFGCLWPVLVNTAAGVRDIDPQVTAAARSLRIDPGRMFFRVRLPAASPQIFAGLRTSLGTALILVVVAELYASSSGLGFVIVNAQREFDILGTWSGVLLLGVIGIVVNSLFLLFEGRVMRWHVQSRKAVQ